LKSRRARFKAGSGDAFSPNDVEAEPDSRTKNVGATRERLISY
jgi:hypothetical protein